MRKMFAGFFIVLLLLSANFAFVYHSNQPSELEKLGERIKEALTLIEGGYYKKLMPEQERALIEGLEKALNNILRDKFDHYSQIRLVPREKTFAKEFEGKYIGIGVGIGSHPEDAAENHKIYIRFLKSFGPGHVFTKDEQEKANELLKRVFGVIVGKRGIYIRQAFKNGGAHLAGVKRGWSIIVVENKKGEMQNVIDMPIEAAVALIKGSYLEKGSENTVVRIKFKKPDGEEVVLRILRKETAPETVWGEMKTDEIGYIQIFSFGPDTVKGFEGAISKLKKRGMKKLVIDVRNNPGGLKNAADGILDRLVPPGRMMLFHESRGQKGIALYSNYSVPVIFEGPIVVLANDNSASASEILAGVLKEHKLATIVGEKTFGKGLVQSSGEMRSGGEFYITISEYVLPVTGYRVQGNGIEPDIPVKNDPLTLKDEALDMALEVLKTK